MNDYFSINGGINIPDIPTRTGYIYGYLKVKEYLEENNLKIKDIISIDWKKLLNKKRYLKENK